MFKRKVFEELKDWKTTTRQNMLRCSRAQGVFMPTLKITIKPVSISVRNSE